MKLKHTTILLLALGGMVAFGPALSAQDTNTPAPLPPGAVPAPHVRGFAGIAQQLDLTPDQQPKVKAAFESMMKKMRDVRQNTDLTPDDRRAQIKTIRDETNETLKGILTPEQYAKWLKLHPGQRSRPAAAPPTAPQ